MSQYRGNKTQTALLVEDGIPQKAFTFTRYSIASERHKEHNEDTVLVDQRRGLAAVFDGVGGSSAGQVASQIASRVIQQRWKEMLLHQPKGHTTFMTLTSESIAKIPTITERIIREAHEQIRHDGQQRGTENGNGGDDQATTIALATFYKHEETHGYMMVYAYVGDSRVYILRKDGQLERLTQDDGLLTTLIDMQVINEEDALRIDQTTHVDQLSDTELLYFKRRNGITQALGDSQSLFIHVDQVPVNSGDRIVLCTDGIHDNLTDAEIEETLKNRTSTMAARGLVQRALQRSRQDINEMIRAKPDDMSAIVITCH